MRGDNLLISNFDRWCSQGDRCVSVVYIRERCGYTPVDGGYSKRVVVEGDRERLRDAARGGVRVCPAPRDPGTGE